MFPLPLDLLQPLLDKAKVADAAPALAANGGGARGAGAPERSG